MGKLLQTLALSASLSLIACSPKTNSLGLIDLHESTPLQVKRSAMLCDRDIIDSNEFPDKVGCETKDFMGEVIANPDLSKRAYLKGVNLVIEDLDSKVKAEAVLPKKDITEQIYGRRPAWSGPLREFASIIDMPSHGNKVLVSGGNNNRLCLADLDAGRLDCFLEELITGVSGNWHEPDHLKLYWPVHSVYGAWFIDDNQLALSITNNHNFDLMLYDISSRKSALLYTQPFTGVTALNPQFTSPKLSSDKKYLFVLSAPTTGYVRREEADMLVSINMATRIGKKHSVNYGTDDYWIRFFYPGPVIERAEVSNDKYDVIIKNLDQKTHTFSINP